VRTQEDPLGVEAVYRLVEKEYLRVPEQRRRYPEALGHAEGKGACFPARHIGQTDKVEYLVDAPTRYATRLRQRQEVVSGLPPGVVRLGVQ
jgi:hypothetical protein